MIISDVSFGIFAFLPQGWVFMLFIILIECILASRFLTPQYFDKNIYWIIALSNITSGAAGIITTLKLNGGWFLVVWFPWISRHEIDLKQKGNLQALIIYYAIAFVLSLIIEGIVNVILLKKRFPVKQIIKATILANIISYTIGTFILYSYSFH